MPAIFEYRYKVTAADIDGVGHVNNISYLRWMQDAAVAHSAAQGWPSKAYHQLGQGWVVRSHAIEYLIPAYSGDEIVVKTWVANMKRVTSMRRYELIRISDEKKLAVASTNWAFVKFETHQPCRVPAEIVSAFEIVPDADIPSSS